jgi:hypothetical protein
LVDTQSLLFNDFEYVAYEDRGEYDKTSAMESILSIRSKLSPRSNKNKQPKNLQYS